MELKKWYDHWGQVIAALPNIMTALDCCVGPAASVPFSDTTRPLPGQDLHLLDQRTFARRTWTNTLPCSEIEFSDTTRAARACVTGRSSFRTLRPHK